MSNNFPYDMHLLWDTINDGLTFFQDEFSSLLSTPKGMKGFAVRPDDKTGSCYIKKSTKSGLYLFTDFGANNITPDQKGVNAIDYVMQTRNVDYAGACKILFKQYNLPISEKDQSKPITEFSSNVTKKDGYFKVDFYSKIQDTNGLKRIIPFYTDKLLAEYDFKQIKKYERVGTSDKGLYHFTSTATPEFPIYGYDKNDFVKLYQPNAPKGDKYLQKHSFVGKKPERPIYGWDNLLSKVDDDAISKLEIKIDYASSTKEKNELIRELNVLKLDHCIIATGGSDGLNIASLGYHVIWFNSETEVISKSEYYELKRFVKNIYYCPDLDKTGVTQAVKLAMNLTKIKIIWLPETLKEFNKKDAADWIRANKSLGLEKVQAMFAQILSQAIEFQFWKWNEKRGTYTLSVNQMLQFLKYNGFFQYKIETNGSDNTKKAEEKIFIQVQNNVAKQVFPSDIKEFVLNWLRTNFISLEIQEMIIKSVFFSERSGLTSLGLIDLKTKTGTKDSQIYFFNEDAVVVTKDAIKVAKSDSINIKTWESNIIKRNFKLQDAPFRIFTNETGNLDIEILNDASNYFKVLINTSRVFWQKDIDKQGNDTQKYKITSENLTDEENQLQKLQLINKIFCIAHLLHKYKQKSKSYLILGIDRKIGESTKDNNGGSGKSFTVETVFNYVFNRNIIDGRNLHKDDSKFMLDGVTKETDIVYFEDLSAYFDLNSLFNFVTGEIKANHKGGKIVTIPFTDFAKPVVTMNAVPHNITPSLLRRLATFECCDYYHEISEEYKETRTIRTDFGKDLFDENYTAEEWANEDNFMMYALQFYLNTNAKIELDGGNLMVRNLVQKIGDPAMKFFTNFFSDPTNLSDRGHESKEGLLWVHKKLVYDFYKEEVSQKAKSSQEFKDILDLYCKFKGWTITFAKKKVDGTGNSVEHFNINMGENAPVAKLANNSIEDEEETDLPF